MAAAFGQKARAREFALEDPVAEIESGFRSVWKKAPVVRSTAEKYACDAVGYISNEWWMEPAPLTKSREAALEVADADAPTPLTKSGEAALEVADADAPTCAPMPNAPDPAHLLFKFLLTDDPAPPSFAEKYEVLEILGKGSLGEVFRVRAKVGGQLLAAKRLKCRSGESPKGLLQDALREVYVMQLLRKQSCIVPLVDTFISGGYPVLVMADCGTSLRLHLHVSGCQILGLHAKFRRKSSKASSVFTSCTSFVETFLPTTCWLLCSLGRRATRSKFAILAPQSLICLDAGRGDLTPQACGSLAFCIAR